MLGLCGPWWCFYRFSFCHLSCAPSAGQFSTIEVERVELRSSASIKVQIKKSHWFCFLDPAPMHWVDCASERYPRGAEMHCGGRVVVVEPYRNPYRCRCGSPFVIPGQSNNEGSRKNGKKHICASSVTFGGCRTAQCNGTYI